MKYCKVLFVFFFVLIAVNMSTSQTPKCKRDAVEHRECNICRCIVGEWHCTDRENCRHTGDTMDCTCVLRKNTTKISENEVRKATCDLN